MEKHEKFAEHGYRRQRNRLQTRRVILWLALILLLAACAQPLATATPPTAATPGVIPPPTAAAGSPTVLPPTAAISPTAAVRPSATTHPTAGYPTGGWKMASPESQGLDAKILARAVSAAAENMAGLKSLLVIRHGYIVSETYFQGTSAETTYQLYSVTKSFTGTLVGIAADQGLIDIQRKVLSFFPGRTFANMNLAKQAMAVAHLLTMTSGMAWIEGDATYIEMYQSSDWVRYVLDRPMGAEPGTEFVYNSGVSHVLSAIVNEAVKGQKLDTLSFAQKYLFRPLGINEQWDKDSQGIPIGGWGLRLTPRDMAKLGYLYLREGAWEGKQIVSSEWVRAATQRQAPLSLNDLGYGYQWWVYPLKGQYAQYVAYTALGRFGQTVFVVPALDLIVVTTAQLDGHNLIFRLIDEFIVPAMK